MTSVAGENLPPRPLVPPGEILRENYRKILIVRLSSVGDVVFALPALETLRAFYPRAHISWIVEDRASSLLEGHPWIDELIVLPRKSWRKIRAESGTWTMLGAMRRFFRALRQRRFDLAIDFQGNLKSGAVTYLSGAPRRLGLPRSETKEPNWIFTTDRLVLEQPVIHRMERDLRLLTCLDLPFTFRWPTLHYAAADRQPIDEYFDHTLDSEKPVILLHPGTSAWGPHKRWPEEYFARLGDSLFEHHNAQIVVNWGPGEEELAARIRATMTAPSYLAPSTPNMRQVGYFLSRCDLIVGSDTGPTHLAALQRRPTIILFGPYDPRFYYPYQNEHRALFAGLPCSPCRYRTCGARDCMYHLPPGLVFDVCDRALRRTPHAAGPLTPNKTVPV